MGVFVGPALYPDSELLALVAEAVEVLSISTPDALRAFGRYSLPKLIASYPDFADASMTAKEFLLSVDGVIHV